MRSLTGQSVECFDQKLARVLAEEIEIGPYDPLWPALFHEEKSRLLTLLPHDLIGRIEHFGSTAIPGIPAKPIVDMLVEVADLEAAKPRVVPVLEARGYDYFWHPNHGDTGHPYYAWFIRRDQSTGKRTHHIHLVERDFRNWEALLFRDYLIERNDLAREYLDLKLRLAARFTHDRAAYTHGKGEFVVRVTEEAKRRAPLNPTGLGSSVDSLSG